MKKCGDSSVIFELLQDHRGRLSFLAPCRIVGPTVYGLSSQVPSPVGGSRAPDSSLRRANRIGRDLSPEKKMPGFRPAGKANGGELPARKKMILSHEDKRPCNEVVSSLSGDRYTVFGNRWTTQGKMKRTGTVGRILT